ncbi:DNA-directed RNA polymerase subunit P [Candidatus Bathyarchaeota archaeon]|nr:DNA-directed RNA polymerase subunit P [Candidatus Bathyarchaeota archaeon]
MSKKDVPEITYQCVMCGAMVSSKEIELRGGGVKCTICGYRVIKKIRSPIVKRVSAR